MPKVDIREVEDWEILFVDNKKVLEGHRLNVEDVLNAIGVEHTRAFYEEDQPTAQIVQYEAIPDDLLEFDALEDREVPDKYRHE